MINSVEVDDGEGAAPLVDFDDFGVSPTRPDASEVPVAPPVASRPEPSDVVLPPPRRDAIESTEAVQRMAAPRRSRVLPWVLGGALLLVGGTIAAAIGLSGPEIAPSSPAGSGGNGPLPAAAPSDAAPPPDAAPPADAPAPIRDK